jgi:ribonuclease HII
MAVSIDHEIGLGGNVIGVDEAGRGPLAGAVFAAAVYVPIQRASELLCGEWSAINDSKKLSEKKREALALVIKDTPGCVWAVANATPREIDVHNILRATHIAMRRAVAEVAAKLGASDCGDYRVLVDGLRVDGFVFPSSNLVKGDAKSLLVAAASILAKTTRDADCVRMEAEYPGYGFAKHKGYPTKAHLAALAKLGPCPEHRRSFAPVAQGDLFQGIE